MRRHPQLDDVRMPQQLKELDLSFDSPHHVSCLQLPTTDDLECDLLLTNLMHGQLDLAKASFAQRLDNFVLTQPLVARRNLDDLRWSIRGRSCILHWVDMGWVMAR